LDDPKYRQLKGRREIDRVRFIQREIDGDVMGL